MSKRLHVKYPLLLSDFKVESKDRLRSIKMRPVTAELFHADGETGMTKRIVAFRNFANVPKSDLCWEDEKRQTVNCQARDTV